MMTVGRIVTGGLLLICIIARHRGSAVPIPLGSPYKPCDQSHSPHAPHPYYQQHSNYPVYPPAPLPYYLDHHHSQPPRHTPLPLGGDTHYVTRGEHGSYRLHSKAVQPTYGSPQYQAAQIAKGYHGEGMAYTPPHHAHNNQPKRQHGYAVPMHSGPVYGRGHTAPSQRDHGRYPSPPSHGYGPIHRPNNYGVCPTEAILKELVKIQMTIRHFCEGCKACRYDGSPLSPISRDDYSETVAVQGGTAELGPIEPAEEAPEVDIAEEPMSDSDAPDDDEEPTDEPSPKSAEEEDGYY